MAAGRIRDDDIALVRERARIDEVVSAYVTLRGAGPGRLKGLCPFHDEKTPSFQVTPSRGFYHCFGCQEGGDVITFVEKIEGVGFAEAVERLADRFGVALRYEDEGRATTRPERGQKTRLIEANRYAAEFYREQLATADAAVGRQFLTDRGFDAKAAERFGVGFAPRSGEAVTSYLRSKGFTEDEMVAAGLISRGSRGLHDRFRGRLLWPIREPGGDVVGFGARRLFDDDYIDAKYLNTPETAIYKKSRLLYGVDLARREIARTLQAVVVEGYTDVMACHLAGVGTAVATCGTSFGDEHIGVLRRLLLDNDEFRGEVIFTFDGDEAGRKAALRTFSGDQQFVGQTYVAIEPEGRDPCDLRLAEGDAAVRELVARRVPLYRFVLKNVVARFDLDRADSRIDAVREAARLVVSIRDKSKVEAFAREVAGMVGVEVDDVRAEIRRAGGRPSTTSKVGRRGPEPAEPAPTKPADVPDAREHRYAIERDALKILLQNPTAIADHWAELEATDFTHPWYRAIHDQVAALGGAEAATPDRLVASLTDERVRALIPELSVERIASAEEAGPRLGAEYVVRLRELTAQRRIYTVKMKLQRMNPVTQQTEYNRLFGELVALEGHRRTLREAAIGTSA